MTQIEAPAVPVQVCVAVGVNEPVAASAWSRFDLELGVGLTSFVLMTARVERLGHGHLRRLSAHRWAESPAPAVGVSRRLIPLTRRSAWVLESPEALGSRGFGSLLWGASMDCKFGDT